MRKRGLSLVAAVVLALPGLALAATPAEPLPPHIAGRISVKSPVELLAALDGYLVEASEGTPNALPPGLLTMLATIYSPIPVDSWKADEEVHLVFLPDARPSAASTVALFRVDDFAAFIESLQDRDWLVGEADAEHGFASLRPVVMPGGKALAAADLGGGKAALADSAERIRLVLADGWTPAMSPGVDVCAQFSLGGGVESLVERTVAYINRRKDGIVDAITRKGIKPAVAEGAAAALEKYAPEFVREMEAADGLFAALRLGGGNLELDLGVRFADGSLAREIVDNAAAAPALDLSLAERFSKNAASVSVGASPASLVPDVRRRYTALAGDVYGLVWPAFKARLTALVDDYFRLEPGPSATASFLAGDRRFSAVLIRTAHPEEMLKLCVDAVQEMNALWNASIDNPDLEARFAGELKNSGSQVYHAFQPWFGKDRGQAFQKFLDGLAEANPELRPVLKINHDFRIFLSRIDDAVVVAAGDMRDDEFTALLGDVRDAADEPLFRTPAASAILPGLTAGRIGVSVLNADETFRLVASAGAGETDVRAALSAMRTQNRGDVFGVSFGGEDGWLLFRGVVPSAAVNSLLRDYESFSRERRRASERPAAPTPPDGEEGEMEEETGDEGQVDAA